MARRKKCDDCGVNLCAETSASLDQLQKYIVEFMGDNWACTSHLQIVVDINPCSDGCSEGKYTIELVVSVVEDSN